MALGPGDRIGAYELLTVIGAGGMGQVYRGRDTKLGREVAIKVLLDAVAVDADRIARFEREARLLAALNGLGRRLPMHSKPPTKKASSIGT
jgi:serine/threonine protein kinase